MSKCVGTLQTFSCKSHRVHCKSWHPLLGLSLARPCSTWVSWCDHMADRSDDDSSSTSASHTSRYSTATAAEMAYPDAIVTPAGAPAGPPIPVPVNGPIAVQTQTDWPLRERTGGEPERPERRAVCHRTSGKCLWKGLALTTYCSCLETQRADAYATARAVALAHHTKPH